MSAQSGKYGQVDFGASAYAEANHWTMDRQVDAEQYGAFGGAGWKKGATGNKSATGTVEGKYDFADVLEELVDVGDEVTLKLYLSTTSSPIAADNYFTVPAQITKVSYDVDGDSGKVVGFSLDWQSNGPVLDPA